MIIKEYLKLARSFNAGLTSLAPVLGAAAMEQFEFTHLFLLFLIGFFGHSYGFALNDILDFKIDQTSKELGDRPLLSKKISIKNAWIFTLSCLIIAYLIAIFLAWRTNHYFPLFILFFSLHRLYFSEIWYIIGYFNKNKGFFDTFCFSISLLKEYIFVFLKPASFDLRLNSIAFIPPRISF